MTEHDKQSSGVEAAANVQPSQGRRRWVKGAMFAMPAIVTLHSGAAWALGSCQIVNDQGNPVSLTDLKYDESTQKYYYMSGDTKIYITNVNICGSNLNSVR